MWRADLCGAKMRGFVVRAGIRRVRWISRVLCGRDSVAKIARKASVRCAEVEVESRLCGVCEVKKKIAKI